MKNYYERHEIPEHLLRYFEEVSAPVIPSVVLDPFSGSGTTLHAARRLGRRSIGIDIDERSAEHLRSRLGNQGVLL